jgi:IS605 OrfB family transposase
MSSSIVRTDRWTLNPTPDIKHYLELTVSEYQTFCKALSYVVMGHWVQIATAESPCAAVEKLIHQTTKNPNPKYRYFDQRFYKFPSYLRRAAIEFVCAQVSSFLTRYRTWQAGIRSRRDAKPPRFNPDFGCYPVLYRGQCIKFYNGFSIAEIKVWNGSDWVWANVPIASQRQRHLIDHSKALSPYLVVKQGKAHLSVPFKMRPGKLKGESVCAVDVGINTTATATIISSDGTVSARQFFHRGADIDHRDKILKRISRKARITMGSSGKLHKGFCARLHRKAQGINRNMSHHISKEIVEFALTHGASVIVMEDLKLWKPKGGRKRSTLKQRFHGWLHRLLVQLTEQKFQELGGKVELVYPRGTSSWAFDGSGEVKRDKFNYALATFTTGKRYCADLNGSYNIGARYWAYKLKLAHRNGRQLPAGKSSSGKQRMPVTLSHLWDREAAHVRAAP